MMEFVVSIQVTYTLERDGKLYMILSGPARVCRESGEQYFARETVRRIRAIIKRRKQLDRVIETPVYEYAWDWARRAMSARPGPAGRVWRRQGVLDDQHHRGDVDGMVKSSAGRKLW